MISLLQTFQERGTQIGHRMFTARCFYLCFPVQSKDMKQVEQKREQNENLALVRMPCHNVLI